MRRYAKPFYWICVAVFTGYLVYNVIVDRPSECWESGATKRYCVD